VNDDDEAALDGLSAAWRAANDALPAGWELAYVGRPERDQFGFLTFSAAAENVGHGSGSVRPAPRIMRGQGPSPSAAVVSLVEKVRAADKKRP
jgi:hypothetical protein